MVKWDKYNIIFKDKAKKIYLIFYLFIFYFLVKY